MDWSHGAHSVTQTRDSVSYRYTEVRHPVTKRGNCPACGKRRTRSTTLANTVNPLNKNPETGLPRTESEVAAVLAAKAEAWTPDFTCRDCMS